MPKMQITVNDETMEALRKAARKHRQTIAAYVRESMERQLKTDGFEVDTFVPQGNPDWPGDKKNAAE